MYTWYDLSFDRCVTRDRSLKVSRAILDTKHSLVASSRKFFGVSSRGRNRRKLNSTSYFRNSHDFPCNSFALLSVSLARIGRQPMSQELQNKNYEFGNDEIHELSTYIAEV